MSGFVSLNKFRKGDKCKALLSILSHFSNKFNKFSNTGAHMLASKYQMTIK